MQDNGWGPDSNPSHALGRQLHMAAKASRDFLGHRLSVAGASFPVWIALYALSVRGALIQRQLADMLNVEGPTLTRHLARMEADGLVSRTRDETDKRAAVIELTDAGREMQQRLSVIASESGKKVLAGFSPQEIEQFISFLGRVIDNVEGAGFNGSRDASSAASL